jgi:hypothetical protein
LVLVVLPLAPLLFKAMAGHDFQEWFGLSGLSRQQTVTRCASLAWNSLTILWQYCGNIATVQIKLP